MRFYIHHQKTYSAFHLVQIHFVADTSYIATMVIPTCMLSDFTRPYITEQPALLLYRMPGTRGVLL